MKAYMPRQPGARHGFSHTKPAFVVDDLSELRGPSSGTVALPLHIDWTEASTYDLADPGRVRTMIETVLREAGSEAEVAEWIDRGLLLEHWSQLNLPTFVRAAWEAAHPELSEGRPYSPSFVLPDSLDDLSGPTTGTVDLPNRLMWNPSRPFDLADEKRLCSMIRTVVREARTQEDLADYIDRDSLIRLWPTLGIPDRIADA